MDGFAGELRSVLIVDDEPDLRVGLKEFLEATIPKLQALTAKSGAEGLDILRKHTRKDSIDLIVTDYRMPGMNGLEFLQQVAVVAPNIPAILLTAFAEMQLALQAFQARLVTQILKKPYDPEEVRAVAEAILDKTFTPEQRAEAFRRSMELSRKGLHSKVGGR